MAVAMLPKQFRIVKKTDSGETTLFEGRELYNKVIDRAIELSRSGDSILVYCGERLHAEFRQGELFA